MADRTPPDTALPDMIDEAIDRVVREMMNVEPAGDLRQRVLDELAGPCQVLPWRALASASAGLAAIVLLVVTLITRQPAPPESRVATTRAGAPATQQTTPPPATDPANQEASPAVRRDPSLIARRPGRVPPPAAQERLVEAASIPGPLALEPSTAPAEPLAPVLPVALTTLDTPPIKTSEIEITPIALERLEILPLPSRR
jgi:hypothetical protein